MLTFKHILKAARLRNQTTRERNCVNPHYKNPSSPVYFSNLKKYGGKIEETKQS